MRPSIALCAVALLAGSAAARALSPESAAPRRLTLNLLHDIYRLEIPVDLDHDVTQCEPHVPLVSANGQVPRYLEFRYYPCTGAQFRAHMSGPDGVIAQAAAEGRVAEIYHDPTMPVDGRVNYDGTDFGYVVVVASPHPEPLVIYRPAP